MNKKIISIVLLMLFSLFSINLFANSEHQTTEQTTEKKEYHSKTLAQLASSFYDTTGIKALLNPSDDVMTDEPNPANSRKMTAFEQTWGRIIMFGIVFYYFI